MNKLTYAITINAPRQKVWEVMLTDQTYREWTTAFHAGSYYEGNWEKGSKILFLGPGEDGKLSGMSAQIADNKPYEYISIEHVGEIVDGVEDTTSDRVKQWSGSHENYHFNEIDGVTTLTVEIEAKGFSEEMAAMFAGMWPKALKKLKEVVER